MYHSNLLTDHELQLMYRSPKPDAALVEKLRRSGSGDQPPGSCALAVYYFRRVRRGGMLMEEELRELVEYYGIDDFDGVAQNVMGDCAIFDLLTIQQCEYMLSILSEREWARQQIHARIVLLGDVSDKLAIVEKLIELKSLWGVLEILPTVSVEELSAIRLRMMDRTVFSRYDRHIVREVIDKMVRDDKKKQ